MGSTTAAIDLVARDGVVRYWADFLAAAEADRCFAVLLRELAWRSEHITMFGKSILVPRQVCWYGDPGAAYTYSGARHEPLPWHPLLLDLKQRLEGWCGARFNSVLGNLYRDGQDSMGWHADKEAELGANPAIASLSLGAPRLFCLQHNKTRERLQQVLGHGSLLLMAGALQHHWRHAVPKQSSVTAPRINLTFRLIVAVE